MKWTPDQIDSIIKLIIGATFCVVLLLMSSLAMYSVVFVTQPMVGIAPADKQFFMLLSDMSKYILGALATLLAIKGKDGVAKLIDPPPGVSKASDWTDPPPPAPKAPAATHAPVRMEPTIDPISSSPSVATGYGGKPAPVQPPHPEIS
jgi:hypothetical protein